MVMRSAIFCPEVMWSTTAAAGSDGVASFRRKGLVEPSLSRYDHLEPVSLGEFEHLGNLGADLTLVGKHFQELLEDGRALLDFLEAVLEARH